MNSNMESFKRYDLKHSPKDQNFVSVYYFDRPRNGNVSETFWKYVETLEKIGNIKKYVETYLQDRKSVV